MIINRHVMKNAMIPLLTVFAPLIPDMITGSIFVEAIFRVPGLGRYWVTSTFTRDYTMIIGLAMLWTVLIGLTYLITDVLYTLVDPAHSLSLAEPVRSKVSYMPQTRSETERFAGPAPTFLQAAPEFEEKAPSQR